MKKTLIKILASESGKGIVELCLDFELMIGISGKKFTKIEGLELFPDLEILSICNHEISDFSGLEPALRLKSLNLSQNSIQSLKSLSFLPDLIAIGLTSLNISLNEIDSLSGLERMPDLKELDLGHNYIRNLIGIENNKGIEALVLSGNSKLKSVSGIENLSELRILYLLNTGTQDWNGLGKCVNLRELHASPINWSEFAIELKQLIGLETLYLSGKYLPELLEIPPLPHLKSIHISKAPGMKQVVGLNALGNLKTLIVKETALESIPKLPEHQAQMIIDISILSSK